MEHRPLGHSGLRVSRLALGTMTWGLTTDADDAAEQLTLFRDAGGTLIDTAAHYQHGHAEHILGDLLTSVVARDEVTIATKAAAAGHPGSASRAGLLDALDGSLRRLDVDHLDLWQLQTWDPTVPLDETLAALDTAVTSGKVRYTGVSNYTGWQLATAAATAPSPLISTQLEYSLLERGIEREALPAAAHHGLGILAWAPLARGVLTGKYRTATPADSRATHPRLVDYVNHHRTEHAAQIVRAVTTAADELDTTPGHIALAWVRDRPTVTAAIIGPRTTTQLATALTSETLTLPEATRSALDDVSAPTLGYPERGEPCD